MLTENSAIYARANYILTTLGGHNRILWGVVMKVVIVGGVAGGASTAARLRRLNEQAQIILFERGEYVSYANCGLPYYIGGVIKQRERLLVQTPEKLNKYLNLDVRIRQEIISIDTAKKTVTVNDLNRATHYEESWDKLVLCPGGKPFRPSLPGSDNAKIYCLQDIRDMDIIQHAINAGAKNVVIIGGGFIGIEMAENLAKQCANCMTVDVVEMLDQILPPFDKEMARSLSDHMIRHGIRVHLSNHVVAFHDKDQTVVCELQNGEHITADFVISAIGVRPSIDLAKNADLEIGPRGGIKVNAHMQTSHPDIYAAGDAVEVVDFTTGQPALIPLAGPANRQGRVIADNICGRNTQFKSVQGSAIVQVFDMTAACTGANEKRLQKENIPYRKIHIHPPGHAAYYPGTEAMHLKLLFTPDAGKLLGAQITGFDGVDKRIDVLATALRAGLSVFDLEELELAYAPPYSSAKDPVNMAGFVAANLLRGDTHLWYAENYAKHHQEGIIIDVRTTLEYEFWHIPDAINLPLQRLRSEIATLPRDKPIFVYCRVGFRSYLAYRILRLSGFNNVNSLAGGILTFAAIHDNARTQKSLSPEIAYSEEEVFEIIMASGQQVELDARGLECPGPLQTLRDKLAELNVGDDVNIMVTDPLFLSHLPSWCHSYGHLLLDVQRVPGCMQAVVRKGLDLSHE